MDDMMDMEDMAGPDVSTGEPPEEFEAPFEYDETAPNLAVEFGNHEVGRQALKKIVMRALGDFDEAFEASSTYRERMADDYMLFTGDLPPKVYPYKDCANAHIPIMLENATRLVARASGELFGDWTTVFGVTPIGPGDEQTADILSKHGNWQLRNQITDFKRQMHRAMLMFFVNGDVTCHSYRDSIRGQNRHDVLTCDEFIVPSTAVSTQPDYSDLPFYCKVMNYQRYELQAMRDIWVDVDKVLDRDASWGQDPDSPLATAVSAAQGIDEMQNAKRAPYKIIQFEGWLDSIPNQAQDRFVKLIFDHATQTVLHMSFHEEEDWQDKLRYRREMGELEQYWMAKAQFDAQTKALTDMEEEHQTVIGSEYANDVDKATRMVQLEQIRMSPRPEAPIPPSWMMDPEDQLEEPPPPRKVPIRMFSHGVCIEPLTGVLGLGYGRILADTNRVANVTTSQFIDSATMANSGTIITPSTFTFDGPFEIRPGKHNKVNGMTGQEIRDSIFQMQFPPANSQLLDMAKWATEFAQAAVQAPDVLSGEAGKSGETFRGINSRIDQATKQLTVVTRKFADFFESVLKKNAILNAAYLADEELVNITDQATNTAAPIRVTRDMYDRDYRIEIKSDLKFTSQQQKIDEADGVLNMVMTNPVLSQNMALVFAATKKCFEARGRQDLVLLLGPAPQAPGMPMSMPLMGDPGAGVSGVPGGPGGGEG